MNTSPSVEREFKFTRSAPNSAARLLWTAVRFPVLGVLTLLEPVVRYLLSLTMVLGIFASVMFEILAAGPRFPFLGMSALSLGFGGALFLYYGLIALFLR